MMSGKHQSRAASLEKTRIADKPAIVTVADGLTLKRLASSALACIVSIALMVTMCPAASLAYAVEGSESTDLESALDGSYSHDHSSDVDASDRVNQDIALDTSGAGSSSEGTGASDSEESSRANSESDPAPSALSNRYTSTGNRTSADVSLSSTATVGTIEYGGLAYTISTDDPETLTVTGLASTKPGDELQIPAFVSNAGKLYKVAAIDVTSDILKSVEDGADQGPIVNPYAQRLFGSEAKASRVSGISIPATVERIDPAFFQLFPNATDISVSTDNETYTSYDGALYSADLTQLILVPQGKGSLVLPSSLASVPAYVFSQCNKLSAISFTGSTGNETFAVQNNVLYTSDLSTLLAAPAGLGASASIASECTTIAEGAFQGNATLDTIVVNGVVEDIASAGDIALGLDGQPLMEGSQLSSDLSSADSTTLPAFSEAAIENATIVINASMEADGDEAAALIERAKAAWEAYGFTKFKEPAAPGTEIVPEEGSGFAFILLPDHTLSVSWVGDEAAPAALSVPDYGVIDGIRYTVSTIADNGFSFQSDLIAAELPQTITAIGDSAFKGCASLATLEFACAPMTIGEEAFADTALLSIVLPKGVQRIGNGAFSGLSNTVIVALGAIPDVGETALGSSTGISLYVPIADEEDASWQVGLPVQGNHIYQYGVQLTSETLDIEVGSKAALTGEDGYIAAPGDVEASYSYKADPISIDSETGEIEAKKEGSFNVSVSLSITLEKAVVSHAVSKVQLLEPASWNAMDALNPFAPETAYAEGAEEVISPYTIALGDDSLSGTTRAANDAVDVDGKTATTEKLLFTYAAASDSYSVKALNKYITGEVVIPAEYKGKPVATIPRHAFMDCTSITSIYIPSTIKVIEDHAFCGTANIQAFYADSSNMNFASADDGILYGIEGGVRTTLVKYPSVKRDLSYTMPDTIKTIGGCAFCDMKYLEHITLSRNVSLIKLAAFEVRSNTASIKSIAVTGPAPELTNGAFGGGWSTAHTVYIHLPSAAVSGGGTSIEAQKAQWNSIKGTYGSLPTFVFDENYDQTLFTWKDEGSYYSITGNYIDVGASSSGGYTVVPAYYNGKPVKTITTHAFLRPGFWYKEMRVISMPGTIDDIGWYCWCQNGAMACIDIATGNLKYKTYEGALYTLENNILKELIRYPPGKTGVSAVIPDTVVKLHEDAFCTCTNLESITLGKSVKDISYVAFENCSDKLRDIWVTGGEAVICSSTSGQSPWGIGWETSSPDVVVNVHIPSRSLTGVDPSIPASFWLQQFARMKATINVMYDWDSGIFDFYPDDANNPTQYAVAIKSSAKGTVGNLSIPAYYNNRPVTATRQHAFWQCSNVTSITIPSTVRTWGLYSTCQNTSLQSIEVALDNEYLRSVDGVLYSKDMSVIYRYPTAKAGDSFTLPGTVKTIAEDAFCDVRKLASLTLGPETANINYVAFESLGGTTALKDIYVPGRIPTVDPGVFAEWGSDKEVNIHIGAGATAAEKAPWQQSFTRNPPKVNIIEDLPSNLCTVYFQVKGAETYTVNTTKLSYVSAPDIYKTGYHIPGWFVDESLTTEFDLVNQTIAATMTLYSEWRPNEYTVTLNPGSGNTVSPTSVTVKYDANYGTMPTPINYGYKFDGWYTEANGGTLVTSATKVQILAPQTLYAHWTLLSFRIRYAADDPNATLPSGTGNITVEDSAPTLATISDASRYGYTLSAWTGDTYKQGGIEQHRAYSPGASVTLKTLLAENQGCLSYSGVQDANGNNIQDLTLNAEWTANRFAIRYTKGGGESGADVIDDNDGAGYAYDSTAGVIFMDNVSHESVLGKTGFKTLGHTVDSWTVKTDGLGAASGAAVYPQSSGAPSSTTIAALIESYNTANPSDKVTSNATPEGADLNIVTVSATWKESTYSISYAKGDATDAVTLPVTGTIDSAFSVMLGKEISAPLGNTLGYVSNGWELVNSSDSAKSQTVTAGITLSRDNFTDYFNGYMENESITLTAQWTEKDITIRYNKNNDDASYSSGGTSPKRVTMKYTAAYTLPIDTNGDGAGKTAAGIVYEGYNLEGWRVSPESVSTISAAAVSDVVAAIAADESQKSAITASSAPIVIIYAVYGAGSTGYTIYYSYQSAADGTYPESQKVIGAMSTNVSTGSKIDIDALIDGRHEYNGYTYALEPSGSDSGEKTIDGTSSKNVWTVKYKLVLSVSYISNDTSKGTVSEASREFDWGASLTVPSTTSADLAQYRFNGWSVDVDSYKVKNDKQIVAATWADVIYTVTHGLYAGTTSDMVASFPALAEGGKYTWAQLASVKCGAPIAATGYKFIDWRTSDRGATTSYGAEDGIAGALFGSGSADGQDMAAILYANMAAKSYHVKLWMYTDTSQNPILGADGDQIEYELTFGGSSANMPKQAHISDSSKPYGYLVAGFADADGRFSKTISPDTGSAVTFSAADLVGALGDKEDGGTYDLIATWNAVYKVNVPTSEVAMTVDVTTREITTDKDISVQNASPKQVYVGAYSTVSNDDMPKVKTLFLNNQFASNLSKLANVRFDFNGKQFQIHGGVADKIAYDSALAGTSSGDSASWAAMTDSLDLDMTDDIWSYLTTSTGKMLSMSDSEFASLGLGITRETQTIGWGKLATITWLISDKIEGGGDYGWGEGGVGSTAQGPFSSASEAY